MFQPSSPDECCMLKKGQDQDLPLILIGKSYVSLVLSTTSPVSSPAQPLSPLLEKTQEQKERFRNIFEETNNWLDATFKLGDWLKEAQDNYRGSTGTILRLFGKIVGYFENRITSGVVEGINNRLKLIKRWGYGFRNFENFQLRYLMCWHFHIKEV
jgi:transposase